MPDVNEILKTVKEEAIKLAKDTFMDYADDAVTDVKDFLFETRDDLLRWTQELADKEITLEEFEDLVKGQKDLAEMTLLKQQGLALIKLDSFKNSLVDLVFKTIITLVP